MQMRARHIMKEKTSISLETTVKDVTHKLISTGLPGLPVVNDAMEVIGIVTEFNVLGAMREGFDLDQIPAARIMSNDPVTADANDTVDDLIQLMLLNNFTVIPITSNGKFVGIVSRQVIMDAYVSPFYTNFTARERKGPFVCK